MIFMIQIKIFRIIIQVVVLLPNVRSLDIICMIYVISNAAAIGKICQA